MSSRNANLPLNSYILVDGLPTTSEKKTSDQIRAYERRSHLVGYDDVNLAIPIGRLTAIRGTLRDSRLLLAGLVNRRGRKTSEDV